MVLCFIIFEIRNALGHSELQTLINENPGFVVYFKSIKAVR